MCCIIINTFALLAVLFLKMSERIHTSSNYQNRTRLDEDTTSKIKQQLIKIANLNHTLLAKPLQKVSNNSITTDLADEMLSSVKIDDEAFLLFVERKMFEYYYKRNNVQEYEEENYEENKRVRFMVLKTAQFERRKERFSCNLQNQIDNLQNQLSADEITQNIFDRELQRVRNAVASFGSDEAFEQFIEKELNNDGEKLITLNLYKVYLRSIRLWWTSHEARNHFIIKCGIKVATEKENFEQWSILNNNFAYMSRDINILRKQDGTEIISIVLRNNFDLDDPSFWYLNTEKMNQFYTYFNKKNNQKPKQCMFVPEFTTEEVKKQDASVKDENSIILSDCFLMYCWTISNSFYTEADLIVETGEYACGLDKECFNLMEYMRLTPVKFRTLKHVELMLNGGDVVARENIYDLAKGKVEPFLFEMIAEIYKEKVEKAKSKLIDPYKDRYDDEEEAKQKERDKKDEAILKGIKEEEFVFQEMIKREEQHQRNVNAEVDNQLKQAMNEEYKKRFREDFAMHLAHEILHASEGVVSFKKKNKKKCKPSSRITRKAML